MNGMLRKKQLKKIEQKPMNEQDTNIGWHYDTSTGVMSFENLTIEQAEKLRNALCGEQKSYASETMNEKGDFDSGFTRMMEKEQKPWSEEDELMLTSIIQTLKLTNGAAQMKIDWLKSLRPHKYVYLYECIKECDGFKVGNIYKSDGEWVYGDNKKCAYDERFFRSQNTWKPSHEKLNALWTASNKYLMAENGTADKMVGKVLESLYNDLKKL